MSATFKFTEDDYVGAYKLAGRPTRRWWMWHGAVGILLVVAGLMATSAILRFATENWSFLLPQKRITISGDHQVVQIAEDHETWQLVRFDYANTHSSTSRYRAYRERIEPVSYQVNSHAGQVFIALLLILPAYLAARVIVRLRER